MEEGPEPQEWVERAAEEHHHAHAHEHVEGPSRGPTASAAITAAILAVMAAIGSLLSGHAANQAILAQSQATDQWAFYQAKKERAHLQDVGAQLAEALGTDPARVRPVIEKFRADEQRYQHESEDLNREARTLEDEVKHLEGRALWLDLSEGFLELGLVLSSLYFLAKRRFFPLFGATCALAGTALAIWSLVI